MRERIRQLELEYQNAKSVAEIEIVIDKIKECLTEIETKETTPIPTDRVFKGLLLALLEKCETQQDIFEEVGLIGKPVVAKKKTEPIKYATENGKSSSGATFSLQPIPKDEKKADFPSTSDNKKSTFKKGIKVFLVLLAIGGGVALSYLYQQSPMVQLDNYFSAIPVSNEKEDRIKFPNVTTDDFEKYLDRKFEYVVTQLSVSDHYYINWVNYYINQTHRFSYMDFDEISKKENTKGYYYQSDELQAGEPATSDSASTVITLNGDFATKVKSLNYYGGGMLKWIDGVYYDRPDCPQQEDTSSIYWRGELLCSKVTYDTAAIHTTPIYKLSIYIDHNNPDCVYLFVHRDYKVNYGTSTWYEKCSSELTRFRDVNGKITGTKIEHSIQSY